MSCIKTCQISSLVFFHIPKSGGTSVTAALRKMFTACISEDGNLSERCFQDHASHRDCLFHGHAQHGTASCVPRGVPTATILREPADQVISNYQHLLRNPGLPLHRAAVELGFSGLMQTHWQLLVFQAISLDVAISAQPIDTPETFFARLPSIRAFLGQIDIVGHLDHIDSFLAHAAWRTGHASSGRAGRLNSAAEHGEPPHEARRLREEYWSLSNEPTLLDLMRTERSLVAYAMKRAVAMQT